MDGFLEQLQQHMNVVESIGDKIENGEEYMGDIQAYLPLLNQILTDVFQMAQDPGSLLELDQEFIVQVLNDILYGMENRDSVFLLDVLRYGLINIYVYIQAELQGGGAS